MKELCIYLNITSMFNESRPGVDIIWWWQIWGIIIKIVSFFNLICFSLEHKAHFPKDSLCNNYLNKRFQGSSKLFRLVWSLMLATGSNYLDYHFDIIFHPAILLKVLFASIETLKYFLLPTVP